MSEEKMKPELLICAKNRLRPPTRRHKAAVKTSPTSQAWGQGSVPGGCPALCPTPCMWTEAGQAWQEGRGQTAEGPSPRVNPDRTPQLPIHQPPGFTRQRVTHGTWGLQNQPAEQQDNTCTAHN